MLPPRALVREQHRTAQQLSWQQSRAVASLAGLSLTWGLLSAQMLLILPQAHPGQSLSALPRAGVAPGVLSAPACPAAAWISPSGSEQSLGA